MLIQNFNLINTNPIIEGKQYSFNDNGVCEIEDKLAKELLKLNGYINASPKDKKPAEAKIEPKKEESKSNIDKKDEKEDIDYNSLSKNELKEHAAAKDIDVPSNATKAELVDILSK